MMIINKAVQLLSINNDDEETATALASYTKLKRPSEYHKYLIKSTKNYHNEPIVYNIK